MILLTIFNCKEERELFRKQNLQLRASLKERYRFGDIIGKSQVMQEVYELIIKAAVSQKDVVICGESGTGKELIAQTIHQLSERQDNAFVPVNCGAIQETLFEREFFGHCKGHLDFTSPRRSEDGHHSRAGVHLDNSFSQQELPLHKAVEQLEKRLILKTLDQHHWHRTNAAALDILRRSLLRKMKKYGIT